LNGRFEEMPVTGFTIATRNRVNRGRRPVHATDLEHDISTLRLRARLHPGSKPARWYSRTLLVPELLQHDPKKLAVEFVDL
jgi:hypothetical protein